MILERAERRLKEEAQVQEQRQKYEADRIERVKMRAKQRAPGLDADGAILQPTQLAAATAKGISPSSDNVFTPPSTASMLSSTSASGGVVSNLDQSLNGGSLGALNQQQAPRKPLNYLEFEHGLPPPNPWDVVGVSSDADDISQLMEVMGVRPPGSLLPLSQYPSPTPASSISLSSTPSYFPQPPRPTSTSPASAGSPPKPISSSITPIIPPKVSAVVPPPVPPAPVQQQNSILLTQEGRELCDLMLSMGFEKEGVTFAISTYGLDHETVKQ